MVGRISNWRGSVRGISAANDGEGQLRTHAPQQKQLARHGFAWSVAANRFVNQGQEGSRRTLVTSLPAARMRAIAGAVASKATAM